MEEVLKRQIEKLENLQEDYIKTGNGDGIVLVAAKINDLVKTMVTIKTLI